jgi:hypothetical protein
MPLNEKECVIWGYLETFTKGRLLSMIIALMTTEDKQKLYDEIKEIQKC